MVKRHQPDLVMMDIVLHGDMDGIDAAEIIKDKWGIPVVFLTAYADTDRLERAKLTYPFGYLLKPFQDRDLKITTEMALYVAKVESDKKRTENRLHRVLENDNKRLYEALNRIPGFVYLQARDYSIRFANSKFIEIFGEPGNRPCYEVCWRRTVPCEVCPTFRVFETNHPEAWEWVSPDGRYFLIYDEPFPGVGDDQDMVLEIAIDITDRKQAEDEIKKQKYYLEKSQELGRIGTWELDLIHNKLILTDQNCSIFGIPEGSVVNYEIFLNKVHPDDREYVDREWKAAIKGKPYDIEHRIVVDNKITWVREKAEIEFNNEGVAISAIGFTQDISDWKKSEEKLLDSEERFRFLSETTFEGVQIHDNGIIIDANKSFADMLGYGSVEEIIGKDLMSKHLTPECLIKVRDAHASGYEGVYEVVGIKNDGTHFPVEIISKAIRYKGKMVRVAASRDITERKRVEEDLAEQKRVLQTILDGIPDIIGQQKPDHTIVRYNKAAYDLLGLPPEEVIGKKCYELIGRFVPCSECSIIHAVQTGAPQQIEKYFPELNRWFRINAIPILDNNQQVESVVEQLIDITERKKSENEIDNLKKTLESLWKIAKLADQDYKVICDNILSEIQSMTGSQYSFFGFMNDDDSEMDIYTWSKEALAECQVLENPIHFSIDKAGLWAEAIRNRKPMIQNDYEENHKGKIGLPAGHVKIKRLATVPIFFHGKMVSVAAVSNKPTDYTEEDIRNLENFISNAHIILSHKEYVDKIVFSEREKETLLKELNHRVKNNMQVIISLMRLQADRIESEELRTSFLETQNRIYAMSAVHETLHLSKNLSSVDLSEYLTKLSDTTFHTYRTDGGKIQFSAEIQPIPVELEKSYPIGLVINEFLSNSLKYAFPDGQEGEIRISGELEGNTVSLIISDTGIGIPQNLDWRSIDSLGLSIVRSLVEDQLQGTIDLDRTHGTKWTITFPV